MSFPLVDATSPVPPLDEEASGEGGVTSAAGVTPVVSAAASSTITEAAPASAAEDPPALRRAVWRVLNGWSLQEAARGAGVSEARVEAAYLAACHRAAARPPSDEVWSGHWWATQGEQWRPREPDATPAKYAKRELERQRAWDARQAEEIGDEQLEVLRRLREA